MAGAGIITFLHNDNFGSALQAYALQRTVRELGVECTLTVAGRREHPARCSGTNSAQADSGD